MRNYLMFGLFALSFVFSANTTLLAQEYGSASYYSDKFQGRKTASGELYDKNKLTGAHKTLKFGTKVKVTRLDNKQSVVIRIIDRGPYIKGRIVDVSRAAAEKLDLVRDGHAEVKIEVIGEGAQPEPEPVVSSLKSPNDIGSGAINIDKSKTTIPKDIPDEFENKSSEVVNKPAKIVEEPKAQPSKKSVPNLKVPVKKVPPAKPVAAETVYTKVRGSDYQMYDLYKIQLERPARSGFGVQVASLTQFENVMKQVAQLQEKWFNNILISVEKGSGDEPIYKLILGPFPDRATAESYKKELKSNKKMDGFVVSLSLDE